MISLTVFQNNYALDVSKYVETRGGAFQASYISWAHCISLLKLNHPNLAVEVIESGDGTPSFFVGDTAFVKVRIINEDDGKASPVHFFPVMDKKFNAIKNPTCTDINYSIMRAKAKVIAIVTGLGLSLFAGEDIPSEAETQPSSYTAPPTDWREAIVPIGKHKGKAIGTLPDASIAWYIENFKANKEYKDSIIFREALDLARKESSKAIDTSTTDEISEQTAQDEDLNEEVTF